MNGAYCNYGWSYDGFHGLCCLINSNIKCIVCGADVVEYVCPESVARRTNKNEHHHGCDQHTHCFYAHMEWDLGFNFYKNGRQRGHQVSSIKCTFRVCNWIKKCKVCGNHLCREVYEWFLGRRYKKNSLVRTVPMEFKGVAMLSEFLEKESNNGRSRS